MPSAVLFWFKSSICSFIFNAKYLLALKPPHIMTDYLSTFVSLLPLQTPHRQCFPLAGALIRTSRARTLELVAFLPGSLHLMPNQTRYLVDCWVK